MAFEGWSDERLEDVEKGLLLLGWQADGRLTSSEGVMIEEIARKALELQRAHALTAAAKDQLAVEAFDILSFQIMNVDERAFMARGPYSESKFFSPLLPLIDEATICSYRGYHTAALAILFIVLESYLRDLMGWTPGMPDPKYYQLKAAVQNLPSSSARDEAAEILAVVYERFDPVSPSEFLFNRHGLLHGVRGPDDVDEMNCARMFMLFDVLCDAEGLVRMVVNDDEFQLRHSAYSKCVKAGAEQRLLKEVSRAEKAVAAHRKELSERSRVDEPIEWARAQRDLGEALSILADRLGGTERFEEAIAAHRAALEEQPRDRVPVEWARTQISLGKVYGAVGKREADTDELEKAVAATRGALEVVTREGEAADWVAAQNNLAHMLETMGALCSDATMLKEAAAAWEACLTAAPEVWPERLVEYVKARLAAVRKRT
jgi:tetratricopeptide (TPR) repeat protein